MSKASYEAGKRQAQGSSKSASKDSHTWNFGFTNVHPESRKELDRQRARVAASFEGVRPTYLPRFPSDSVDYRRVFRTFDEAIRTRDLIKEAEKKRLAASIVRGT